MACLEFVLKKAQGTWKSCCRCGVLMPTTNIESHENQCTDTVADQDALEQLKSGFILNGKLHAVVGVFGRDFTAPNFKPLVFMHPSTMRIFEYYDGTALHLKGNNEEKIHMCWPCNDIERSTIAFPDDNSFWCAPGDKVIVQRFDGPSDVALEMCLATKVNKDFVTCEKFKKHFLKKHNTMYAKKGMVFRFKYFGYPCELTVTKLTGVLSHVPYKSDVDNVTTNLALLSVKDENPPSKTHGDKPNPKSSNTLENKVDYTKPFEYFEITRGTKLIVEKLEDIERLKKERVLLRSIGGLEKQIKELKEIASTFLNLPGSSKYGKIPKAILLTGATGTGKTLTAKALANEFHINLVTITCSDIYDKYSGASVAALKAKCEEVGYSSPSIIFFDEIDTLCPKNNDFVLSNEERIVVLAVIELLDALIGNPHRKVLILAATSKPEFVDPLLLRPGIFDKEIKFDMPDEHARCEIIKKLLQNIRNDITEDQIIQISQYASGYNGADLLGVCGQSVLKALARNSNNDAQTNVSDACVVKLDDILASLKEVKPSAMKEFQIEVPQVLWKDIGGMHQVKQDIMEIVAFPLHHPEPFIRLGISPYRGALLYGPPGCSKTMIARAVAVESKLNFISVKGPELLSKYVGESEKSVHAIFAKARFCAPCIIFFDEIDSLTHSRDESRSSSNVGQRVLSQLLCEIDGVDVLEGVQIIAATNCPESIDSALLRPGRFDRLIYVPLPDSLTRKEIFNLRLRKMPLAADINVEKLVELTEGYSGAEIVALCHDAVLRAITYEFSSGTKSQVTESNLMKAITHRPPQTSEARVRFYEQFNARQN